MKASAVVVYFSCFALFAMVVARIVDEETSRMFPVVATEPPIVIEAESANTDDKPIDQKFKFTFSQMVKVISGFYIGVNGYVIEYRHTLDGRSHHYHIKLSNSITKHLGVNSVWLHESVLESVYPR